MEFARTVHSAGTDLLNLISDILDLSKVESGMMSVDAEKILFADLKDMVVRTFRHEAESRNSAFDVVIDPALERGIVTDSKRLQQVLKNLLSNAFKFTETGGVRLSISRRVRQAGAPVIRPWTRRVRCRVRGLGHRNRYPAREAKNHFRGVSTGRCRH